ncbi:uncharacterized protein LOC114779040 isoform X2 [Denticeps clupeoides]|uniref:uncharacterized protein LOC114779040 isoform X2 n=1 Tax=Denticeps clupeoides TaxID=299321 RepID=UPI0010A3B0E1|nr:uncharacterized protein LOC114779040 isoform X2 [Denticeps clupeoides]
MKFFIYLLCCTAHLTTGCVLSAYDPLEIFKSLDESVLLPCSCTDPQATPEGVKWETTSRTASTKAQWSSLSNVIDKYGHRIQMFNKYSSGNLSLLLTELTKEDQGTYVCGNGMKNRFIRLFVTGPGNPPVNISTKLWYLYILTPVLLVLLLAGAAVTFWRCRRQTRAQRQERKRQIAQTTAPQEENTSPTVHTSHSKTQDSESAYVNLGQNSTSGPVQDSPLYCSLAYRYDPEAYSTIEHTKRPLVNQVATLDAFYSNAARQTAHSQQTRVYVNLKPLQNSHLL